MQLKELLPGIKGSIGDIFIEGITNDSKKVEKGFAFVCLKGSKYDGHEFALSAVKKGASVIISEKLLGLENEIVVEDTRKAYAEMSSNWFGNPSKSIKLIGVTGTNGKTYVTYMIKAILESKGCKTGVIGTIQNMVGDKAYQTDNTTPDAYEINKLFAKMRDEGCEYAVMEVSSHGLDQKRVWNLDFEVAAFTNLTQDHLDYHKTMEGYLEAKKKLFSMCKTAVINLDDRYAKDIIKDIDCNVVTYSIDDRTATFSANAVNLKPNATEFEFVGDFTIKRMRIKTGGRFSVYNALCAAVCAKVLGFSVDEISDAMENMNGVKGRAEIYPTEKDFSVIIDYAHTPDGLENILNTFKDLKRGRLVCVFGCGGNRDTKKRPLMGAVAAKIADFVIVTSDNPRDEEPMKIINDVVVGVKKYKTPYVLIEDRKEAIKYAVQNAEKDDIIVLAGKGHENYQILADGKVHFDEREILSDILCKN